MNSRYPVTPTKLNTPLRVDKVRRFMRKPQGRSERSSSRKSSIDSQRKEKYIKCPTSTKKEDAGGLQAGFFEALAESLLCTAKKEPNTKGLTSRDPYSSLSTSRCALQNHYYNMSSDQLRRKIETLKTELDMKTHQLSLLTGQCQRMKIRLNEQIQRRKKYDKERQALKGQLKDNQAVSDGIIRKLEAEKEHLLKHIKVLEKVAYKKQEIDLQAYREKYLEEQIVRLREQFKKSRGQREQQLQKRLKKVQQEKYCLQSHIKAMNFQNQSLHRQLSEFDEEGFIVNSQIYKKVHNKYKKCMEELARVKNENDRLIRLETYNNESNSSEIFSITASEVEKDLSIHIHRQHHNHNDSNTSFTINLGNLGNIDYLHRGRSDS